MKTLNPDSAQETLWHRIVAERANDGHVVVADADLIARAASPSVYERTGLTPEFLIGSSVLDLIDPADRDIAEVATDHLTRHTGARPPGLFRITTPSETIDVDIIAEHLTIDGTSALIYHLIEIDQLSSDEGLMLSAAQILQRGPNESLESVFRALTRLAQRHLDLVGCRFLVRDSDGELQSLVETTSGPASLGPDSPLRPVSLAASEHQAGSRRAAYHSFVDPADDASGQALRALGARSTVTAPLITNDRAVAGFFETFHPQIDKPSHTEWAVHTLISQIATTALEQRQLADDLADVRSIDDLTALTSRRGLFAAMHELADHSTGAILLLIDIDGFHWINSTLGSSVGDDVLRAAARRIEDALPGDAICCRCGGDEFAALIPIDPSPTSDQALQFGRQMLRAFDTPLSTHHLRRRITVSVGATWTDRVDDADDFLSLAGSAASAAKEAGGNTVRLFDEPQALEYGRGRRIGSELTRAMKNRELYLDFQPIVSLGRAQISSAEALVRWQHPDWGLMPPDQFVPAVDAVGMAIDLDGWVIDEAARWIHKWNDHVPPDFRVWINASGQYFRQRGLAERVLGTVGRDLVHRVGIEISEEAVFAERATARDIIDELRDHHIPVALDDFGTGKSSLETLHWLEADTVKIDRSFVVDLTNDDRSGTLVEAMTGLSHDLGAVVVAEGVESQEQVNRLQQLRVDSIQGFVAFRPMQAEKIQSLVNANAPILGPNQTRLFD